MKNDYNILASSFAKSRDSLWPEISFLFDYTRKGEKVLDLGCGNGRFVEYLKETDYTGVDFSAGMIKEAQRRFPEKKFLEANAINLPFPAESFHKVYGIALLHHIPSRKYRLQVLREIKRVLIPGGYAFFTVWDLTENKERLFWNMLRNIFSPLGSRDIFLKRKKYYHIFTKRELPVLVKKAGFETEKAGTAQVRGMSNFYLIARKRSQGYNLQ